MAVPAPRSQALAASAGAGQGHGLSPLLRASRVLGVDPCLRSASPRWGRPVQLELEMQRAPPRMTHSTHLWNDKHPTGSAALQTTPPSLQGHMRLSTKGGKPSCLSVGGGLRALPGPRRLTDLSLIWARREVPSPPLCLWQALPALPSSSPAQGPTARLLLLPSARLTHTPTPAGPGVSHRLPLHSLAALTSPGPPPCPAWPCQATLGL